MNWYTSRERVKKAIKNAVGAEHDALIDQHIEAASRKIDNMVSTGRMPTQFIPATETRSYDWPQHNGKGNTLYIAEGDLLSVTTLTSQNGGVTIGSSDYFLEPANETLKKRIVINAASTTANAYFAANTTSQRAISVAGSFGLANSTEAAGTVASGLASDATATSMVCSDASLIDVGDTLLIESEQAFVSERSTADTTANLNGGVTGEMNDTTITVSDGTQVNVGEVIQIASEKMLVTAVTSNDLTVIRQYDGSTLQEHTGALDVYAFRTLTITRGVNGTTAATHANATAVSRYRVPADIEALCRAEAIFNFEQDIAGQTGVVGGGDGATAVTSRSLNMMWKAAMMAYGRPLARVL